jgi:hypothetical protein
MFNKILLYICLFLSLMIGKLSAETTLYVPGTIENPDPFYDDSYDGGYGDDYGGDYGGGYESYGDSGDSLPDFGFDIGIGGSFVDHHHGHRGFFRHHGDHQGSFGHHGFHGGGHGFGHGFHGGGHGFGGGHR